MGIVQTLVTVGGVIAIIGLLVLLFCHYLGGWTWTKAWLRSSGEEKMVLTRAGTHRHFNPNGYMVSSDSDLNLSGRGSFRRFDTTDTDYHLFRQGSSTSLTRPQGPSIPPQPLRPAPVPPSFAGVGQLTSQSSLDSVFNTAPSSPALVFGPPVPKIPPPPQHTGSSSSSHASPRSTMGDGNGRGGNTNGSGGGGGGGGGVPNLSSTNPFLPLLQASTQFFSQTIQSFQSGLQQPQTLGATEESSAENMSTSSAPREYTGEGKTSLFHVSGSTEGTPSYSSSSMTMEDPIAKTGSGAGSTVSSVSTVPPNSAGLSMGELLFSAPPVYQSKDLELMRFQMGNGGTNPVTTVRNHPSAFSKETNLTNILGMTPVPPGEVGYLTKQPPPANSMPSSRPIGTRASTGSPQHTRYNLYHQNSAENMVGPPPSGGHGGTGDIIHPTSHSPPPGTVASIRRASYPNRKEYTPHDTIPKSEFPQHIPYIPSPHHHHHAKNASGVERKVGMAETVHGYSSEPHRHHHYLPPVAATPVQPFLEEQEEPPEEPCTHHQLPPTSNSTLDMEREDLKNRIMLETMREEIRIANERMADVTKSLMMDDVFFPSPPSTGSSSEHGNKVQKSDSSRQRNFIGSYPSPSSTNEAKDRDSGELKGAVGSSSSSSSYVSTATPMRESTGASIITSTEDGGTGERRTVSSASGASPSTSKTSSQSPPICVPDTQERSNRTETEAGRKYHMQAGPELQETDVKNGYGNGGAVNASNNCATPGNPPSALDSQRGESLSESQPDIKSGSGAALINALSGVSFNNVMSSSSGSGGNATTTPNRPPTVGSYFKQNSRSFSLRQSSTDSVGSDISDLSSPTDGSMPSLQRAMSCDSVCSDTSVILGDLDPPHMTGHLCIGLEYDSETADLLVNVMEAKDLVGPDPDPNAPFDSYVRVYLLPDKTTNMQTRVYRKSLCPVYKEKFMFGLEMSELANRSLVFYLYATDKYTNTLIGEVELKLGDMDLTQPVVTWLLLTDTGQRGGEFGEIMFSLSYLPTAERLTVVVVKARNLKFPHDRESGDPFVKVYLLQRGKKVSKKKSSTKRGERNPIFNEAMIFSIPAHALQTIQLRITVADSLEAEGRAYSIGHVIVGSVATGKALSHWNQMLSSLRKPIAMWHALRK